MNTGLKTIEGKTWKDIPNGLKTKSALKKVYLMPTSEPICQFLINGTVYDLYDETQTQKILTKSEERVLHLQNQAKDLFFKICTYKETKFNNKKAKEQGLNWLKENFNIIELDFSKINIDVCNKIINELLPIVQKKNI